MCRLVSSSLYRRRKCCPLPQFIFLRWLTASHRNRYQDYLNLQGSEGKTFKSKSYVLEGGVKAWKAKFEGDADLIDGL